MIPGKSGWGILAICLSVSLTLFGEDQPQRKRSSGGGKTPSGEAAARNLALNIHLMHPGGDSSPGDPNAAFHLDGTYHLHYILRHPWQGEDSFSFIHVTSPDLLNWTWQPTKLQPSFTGHGMFSGTGFLTKAGLPAVIYHGKDSDRNHIAIAKDRKLSGWLPPRPVEPKTTDGSIPDMRHWDPDCFQIGEHFYAISGGKDPQLLKSADLENWTHIGNFFQKQLPEVALGEDLSCANFFPMDDKWVLLCISHPLGCRYYIGDWDSDSEQFVPESHHRMNWRRNDQPFDEMAWDYFAPESLLTEDGRRIMWSWCARPNKTLRTRSIQSLPRELSLGNDGTLRIVPARELQSLRRSGETHQLVSAPLPEANFGGTHRVKIASLPDGAWEIRASISREQASRKHFGIDLFADETTDGLPIRIQPEYGTIRVGQTEAPFAVADLPEEEAVDLRIFVDRYMVEVFVNGRQALYATYMDWQKADGCYLTTFGAPTVFEKVDIYPLKPCNEGFLTALENPVWQPDSGASEIAAPPKPATGMKEKPKHPRMARTPDEKPNFIVIFVDDLGNGDIQPFGDHIKTPNLARMAEQGRVFDNFYVGSSVCTPSRAALLTGCYPARIDMLHNDLEMDTRNHGVLWPGDRKGLNPDEITIAEVLRERGYATACIGKWHLGDQPEFLPTRQGFDEYFGIPFSNDMAEVDPFRAPLPMIRGEKVIGEVTLADQDTLTERFTEEAIDFIERNADQPFFLYLPHAMVHKPHAASDVYRGKSGQGIYADAVSEVDGSTGKILKKLSDLGLDQNTLVIFTSDNGAPWPLKRDAERYASNAPFSGGKNTAAEGGFRVPMIAWWPGTIEANSDCRHLSSTIDLLPTFAALSGTTYQAPTKRPIDGIDLSHLFGRDIPKTSPRESMIYYSDNTDGGAPQPRRLAAVRLDRWKYYLHPQRFRLVDGKRIAQNPAGALFNLNTDPGETSDVSAKHRKIVEKLQALAQQYSEKFGDPVGSGTEFRPAGFVEKAAPLNAKGR